MFATDFNQLIGSARGWYSMRDIYDGLLKFLSVFRAAVPNNEDARHHVC